MAIERRLRIAVRRAAATGFLGLALGSTAAVRAEVAAPAPNVAASVTFDIADEKLLQQFLDRLMMAESGGRDDARNPRSTALGAFQFIEATFLDVVRRHFAAETANLTAPAVLALRTNREFARRAAAAFTRDNASALAQREIPTTFENLRLAFLLGPGAAIRLLQSAPETPVITVLGALVVQANPFMAGMKSVDLRSWAARNIAASNLSGERLTPARWPMGGAAAPSPPSPPPRPVIKANCNLQLASCRRWLALAQRRVEPAKPRAAAKRR